MDKRENLHAGHRARMTEKFLKNPDGFSDHEVLEVLLYYAIPRKDTNALAHKILKTFGDLKGVLNAGVEQLKAVDGLGDKACACIALFSQITKRAFMDKKKDVYMGSLFDTINVVVPTFKKKEKECFIAFLLDKNYKLLAPIEFSDDEKAKVSADIPELITAFNVHKPVYAIIAHNHPSKQVSPSEEDCLTTKKLHVLCELHGVLLLDHVIVSDNKTFSFDKEGLLEKIRDVAQLNRIFDKLQGEDLWKR